MRSIDTCKTLFALLRNDNVEGDNFIGYRSTIIGNINVGKGSIIAAGSVVIKDVPEESVVAGIPARIVGKRKR